MIHYHEDKEGKWYFWGVPNPDGSTTDDLQVPIIGPFDRLRDACAEADKLP